MKFFIITKVVAFFFIVGYNSAEAQMLNTQLKVFCDCDSAYDLKLFNQAKFNNIAPSYGPGKVLEIESRGKSTNIAFEREHNSSWYVLNIQKSGELTFEITPLDSNDDYDFLLFPFFDSSNNCLQIRNKKLLPVRSNLAKNEPKSKNTTGLSVFANREFIGKGKGEQYSKNIKVLKGDKYILVIDNVHSNKSSYKLNFNILKNIEIEGSVYDESGHSIIAEVVMYDNNGYQIAKTNSSSFGKYNLKTCVNEQLDYNITFVSEKSFVLYQTINFKNIETKDSIKLISLKSFLPSLKKGKKYKIEKLNFFTESSEILPSSIPALLSIYKLMIINKKLRIQIEGHINGIGGNSPESEKQDLSEKRAMAVFQYLKNKGIPENRMNIIGLSDSHMLFPNAQNELERSANRRVEINVISMN